MYYVEMCKKQGNEEGDWLIEAGKLEEDVDSDGDICYVKKVKKSKDTVSHGKRQA